MGLELSFFYPFPILVQALFNVLKSDKFLVVTDVVKGERRGKL